MERNVISISWKGYSDISFKKADAIRKVIASSPGHFKYLSKKQRFERLMNVQGEITPKSSISFISVIERLNKPLEDNYII